AEVSAARPPAGRTAAVVATRTIGAGLDAATERRLRQGRIPVDRKLDLHGLSEAQAHRRLLAALPAAQADGVRLVLIVTGKGSRDGRTGVLRRSLGRWLEEPGLASLVLSSRPAPPRLGGEGARQVLLRRRRD
ncbi:MAG: DNA mismatch repair protein MutS, partial [Alphaproteobacteria bacterium]|nr:DNA mismatch repair protein MutS [Alphaproteobacteria bacterium]